MLRTWRVPRPRVEGIGGSMIPRRLFAISLVDLLLVALLASCGRPSLEYREPADLGDGWPTAELSEVGLDSAPFVDLVNQAATDEDRAVHGILVVKDGKLVFEEYFDGYRFDYDDPQFRGEPVEFDESTRHNLMSVTKAVTGALVGIAIDEGLIAGVDEPVVGYFTNTTTSPTDEEQDHGRASPHDDVGSGVERMGRAPDRRRQQRPDPALRRRRPDRVHPGQVLWP